MGPGEIAPREQRAAAEQHPMQITPNKRGRQPTLQQASQQIGRVCRLAPVEGDRRRPADGGRRQREWRRARQAGTGDKWDIIRATNGEEGTRNRLFWFYLCCDDSASRAEIDIHFLLMFRYFLRYCLSLQVPGAFIQ